MADTEARPPKLPPAWFKHAFWRVHRALNRLSGDRLLWKPGGRQGWGAMKLSTVGHRTGRERTVIVAYLEDGEVLHGLAMNGWDEGHPAWWRNVQADPDVVVRLPRQAPRPMHAREADGAERERLWQRWSEVDDGLDAYAASREVTTPVVVFELRDASPA